MSIEQQIASLTTATTDLLDAVNVRKATLDEKVLSASESADAAFESKVAAEAAQQDIHTNWQAKLDAAGTSATAATEQAAIATEQAEIATNQAAIATNQAGFSAAAKTAAEAARDAAQLSAGVYATTAAGLAATTNGKYFSVPSAESRDSLILYQNSSGTAVEVKRYPAAAALDFVNETYPLPESPVFSVTDEAGNIALEIPRSGGIRAAGFSVTGAFTVDASGQIETGAILTASPVFAEYAYSVTDENGNVILGVDAQGRLVANFELAKIPGTAYKTDGLYDYSINQIFGYGQSLSVGQATPAISTTQNYDNLMFTRGMRPQYDYPAESDAQWYASLVPAIEAQSPELSILAETPSMGTADMIKERILAEDGKSYTQHQYQILISTPGYGALTIGQLSKGTTHFTRMVTQATYGKTLANAAGKTHAVQAVTWTQGESDYLSGTTQAAYVTALNTLISDINADIKAATGQTKNIPVIGYQVSSHIYYASDDFPDIALAQLEVEAANPLFYIACAMYPFEYQSGGHITSVSTRWLGGYYGLAYKRVVINGEDWKPLKPIASVRQSNFVEIRFHVPDGPLVFDTTQVAAQTNYGFGLLDQNGAAMTISSVEIIDTDRVRITASATIPAGAKVRYAFTGDATTGKGNLRDSQGDTITFAIPGSAAKRMDNWCLIFELTI